MSNALPSQSGDDPRMRLAARLPTTGPLASSANIAAVARAAEELGFASGWAPDHVVMPATIASSNPSTETGRWRPPADPSWLDPLLALGIASTATDTLRLCTGVLVLPLRNPVLLAKQVATLDQLSEGRVVLGVGTGWMAEEFEMVGAPFADRGPRSEESISLMRRLWTGEAVSFDGVHFSMAAGQMSPATRQSRLPVVWAGHSTRVLGRVARLGDGWFPVGLSIAALSSKRHTLSGLCRAVGRDPASVHTVFKLPPGTTPSARDLAGYRQAGIDELVVEPPKSCESLDGYLDYLARAASWA